MTSGSRHKLAFGWHGRGENAKLTLDRGTPGCPQPTDAIDGCWAVSCGVEARVESGRVARFYTPKGRRGMGENPKLTVDRGTPGCPKPTDAIGGRWAVSCSVEARVESVRVTRFYTPKGRRGGLGRDFPPKRGMFSPKGIMQYLVVF